MSKNQFIDFKAVKAAIRMEQVLQHYGLFDQFKRSGDSLSGPCPIHKGSNPTQFRVSVSKNIWHCFSDCNRGGNALDFIARMEDATIHAAALKAIEWFGIPTDTVPASSKPESKPPDPPKSESGASPKLPSIAGKEEITSNPSLKFRLDKLDATHPYLAERGLTPETIADFSIGFCSKGMMAERIAIPIRNPDGNIVAYAGRTITDPTEDRSKYKLPPGFRKSLELFNIDRSIKEPPESPLVIVEGFFGAMKLHQNGCRKVVALMGSTLSPAQEELIRKYTNGHTHIIVMLDEDEAGKSGRDDVAMRLAKWAFVHVHVFAEEGRQPERLSAEDLVEILGSPEGKRQ